MACGSRLLTKRPNLNCLPSGDWRKRDCAETFAPEGSVFEGGHLKKHTLPQAYRRYRDKLGITGENTNLYGLRHRYGHKLAEALPVNRVAAAMGHTQINTTMIYIRAEVEDVADEIRGVAL